MLRTSSVATRVWVVVFLVDALVLLVSRLAGADALGEVTQWLVMPALAGVVLTATRWPRGRLVAGVLVGLGFSFLGDALPSLSGDAAFLVMVGCFLVAQVAYVVAFAPDVRRSVLHRQPLLLVPYGLVLVLLVGLCAPHAGSLLVPVAVYGGVLVAMAVLSTGVGRLAGIGGAVFVVSDGLIALGEFVPGWHLPGQSFWVMLTYVAAQALLATDVIARNRVVRRPAPVQPRPATPPATKLDNVRVLV